MIVKKRLRIQWRLRLSWMTPFMCRLGLASGLKLCSSKRATIGLCSPGCKNKEERECFISMK